MDGENGGMGAATVEVGDGVCAPPLRLYPDPENVATPEARCALSSLLLLNLMLSCQLSQGSQLSGIKNCPKRLDCP